MSQSERPASDYRVTETRITRDDSGNSALVILAIVIVAAIAVGAFYVISTRGSVSRDSTTTIITPAPAPAPKTNNFILPAPAPAPVPARLLPRLLHQRHRPIEGFTPEIRS